MRAADITPHTGNCRLRLAAEAMRKAAGCTDMRQGAVLPMPMVTQGGVGGARAESVRSNRERRWRLLALAALPARAGSAMHADN